MIVEIGHFAFVLAFAVAAVQAVSGLRGTAQIAIRSSCALFALCAIAFAALEYAYVTSDFSVVNVALNSHSLKPMLYKVAGAWGNHEGSMLLWILILSAFGAALAVWPRAMDAELRQRALGMQGVLSLGFIAFSLLTSNPFLRTDTPPLDGNSLNPVLQDPGLAFHPPMLYLGYVGFSAVFSLAAAALVTGRVDAAWARAAKPFTALAWLTLSAGIALGSKWAYYELGWGGWWYWDPVENASLLPWLAGTALLHSILVLETRGALKRWTILLAIIAFSLSLLGTFLVRSGVLTSVHAFAVDPARGAFILGLLAFYCGGAFALYAWRAPSLKTTKLFTPVSREGALVANNLLLITITATVLTGTLYPLLMDALGLGQVSVGPPYYNATVVMMGIPLLILTGIGPFLPWKRPGRFTFVTPLAFCALATAAIALLILDWRTLGFAVAVWLMLASAAYAWQSRRKITFKTTALVLGHFGLGLAAVGMLGTNILKIEDIRVASPGDSFTVGRHVLTFEGVETVYGPNYGADEARVTAAGETLRPQRRWYPVSDSETTEAAIRLRWLDDLYVVLGERDPRAGENAWVLRTSVHPFVSALWAGFTMIVLAGIAMLAASVRTKP